MNLLGVRVDNLSEAELLEKISSFLAGENFHQIATVNPEFILTAGKDPEFNNILNNCDLNVADGFGIKCAFWRFGKNLKFRMAGADLMDEILKIASEKNLKIFLAANSRGLSSWEETHDSILKQYPTLEISGENLDEKTRGYELQVTSCEIVFCNFGAPYQEKFLNSLKNDKIRLVMGVGGSFDYLTGKVPRAPKFMRQAGLEWLFRLFIQPSRWRRILDATIIFPIKIVFNK